MSRRRRGAERRQRGPAAIILTPPLGSDAPRSPATHATHASAPSRPRRRRRRRLFFYCCLRRIQLAFFAVAWRRIPATPARTRRRSRRVSTTRWDPGGGAHPSRCASARATRVGCGNAAVAFASRSRSRGGVLREGRDLRRAGSAASARSRGGGGQDDARRDGGLPRSEREVVPESVALRDEARARAVELAVRAGQRPASPLEVVEVLFFPLARLLRGFAIAHEALALLLVVGGGGCWSAVAAPGGLVARLRLRGGVGGAPDAGVGGLPAAVRMLRVARGRERRVVEARDGDAGEGVEGEIAEDVVGALADEIGEVEIVQGEGEVVDAHRGARAREARARLIREVALVRDRRAGRLRGEGGEGSGRGTRRISRAAARSSGPERRPRKKRKTPRAARERGGARRTAPGARASRGIARRRDRPIPRRRAVCARGTERSVGRPRGAPNAEETPVGSRAGPGDDASRFNR